MNLREMEDSGNQMTVRLPRGTVVEKDHESWSHSVGIVLREAAHMEGCFYIVLFGHSEVYIHSDFIVVTDR